jgi:hypothetical protein
MRSALTADTAELERMGANGRSAVLLHHDIETEAAKLAACFAGGAVVSPVKNEHSARESTAA